MTTHKIDPEMVERIYKSQFANTYEGYTISVPDVNIVIEFNTIADAERFSLLENGVGLIVHDRTVLIDIHRFKNMAIEWCAGKGWVLDISATMSGGYIGIFKYSKMKDYYYSAGNEIRWGKIYGKDYPTRLSAELAAISFVWEQIQEDKTNER